MESTTKEELYNWMKENAGPIYADREMGRLKNGIFKPVINDAELYEFTWKFFTTEIVDIPVPQFDPARVLLAIFEYLYEEYGIPLEICKIMLYAYYVILKSNDKSRINRDVEPTIILP